MPTEADVLELFTVYDKPRDFPGEVVVRVWRIRDGRPVRGDVILRGRSLEQVRAALEKQRPGLYCIPRSPGDDPAIAETWL